MLEKRKVLGTTKVESLRALHCILHIDKACVPVCPVYVTIGKCTIMSIFCRFYNPDHIRVRSSLATNRLLDHIAPCCRL